MPSDNATVVCGICHQPHVRRPGRANVDNPICAGCAEKFCGIPSGQGPKDKVNVKLKTF